MKFLLEAHTLKKGIHACGFSLLFFCLLAVSTGCLIVFSSTVYASSERHQITYDFLLGNADFSIPADASAFLPPPVTNPSNRFEGTLELVISALEGKSNVLLDRFGLFHEQANRISQLPPFKFDFIQSGSDVIPVSRGVQTGTHPYWEWILEPGKAWDEPGDGEYTRVSIPFALQQRNANCTHNGLLTFLYRDDGSISRVAYQVGMETCYYLQLDMWGVVAAHYQPRTVEESIILIDAYEEEVAARLPVRPIEALADVHPHVDLSNFKLHDSEELSTYGFIVDGVHYSGGCNTRHGPYPFCEVLALPSYSLAKSIFAMTALAWLELNYPGAGQLEVTRYVPECLIDNRWAGVTLENLLDMASGIYQSTESQADEFKSYESEFISSDLHDRKITASCTLFDRRREPGTQFVYHSTETYIAGTLMNAFLREQSGKDNTAPDIHSDVLVEQIFKPLGLSPVTWKTKRSYDKDSQPYTGYGLTFHSDDVARFALFLMNDGGQMNGRQILDQNTLDSALQRDPADPGLPSNLEGVRYNNGFWAHKVSVPTHCSVPVWIPFMSGYGGISVVLLPNRTVYYVFSDSGRFKWLEAAIESHKIRNYCG